jgi:hypothetical protein
VSDSFTVKFDTISFESQAPPNLRVIFPADSVLTLPELSIPNYQSSASHDKVANIGGFGKNIPTGSYILQKWSFLPPSDFTSIGSPKHSELLVSTMANGSTRILDYNILSKEEIIPSDQVGIFLGTISSEENIASTSKGNIFGHKDFI